MVEKLNPKHYRVDPEVKAFLAPLGSLSITRCNVDSLLDAGCIQVSMVGRSWRRLRRVGPSTYWPNDPALIYVPWVDDHDAHGYITQEDFQEWFEPDAKCALCDWGMAMRWDVTRRSVLFDAPIIIPIRRIK